MNNKNCYNLSFFLRELIKTFVFSVKLRSAENSAKFIMSFRVFNQLLANFPTQLVVGIHTTVNPRLTHNMGQACATILFTKGVRVQIAKIMTSGARDLRAHPPLA